MPSRKLSSNITVKNKVCVNEINILSTHKRVEENVNEKSYYWIKSHYYIRISFRQDVFIFCKFKFDEDPFLARSFLPSLPKVFCF